MAYDGYETLGIAVGEGVGRVTIEHPPINLFDLPLMLELDRFGREISDDDADPEAIRRMQLFMSIGGQTLNRARGHRSL
jgi:hypothetical protein